jgi:hypothetical protein
MKKIAIIILLAITSFSYAQEQEYDTIVYFPQTIFECPMLFDPVYSPIYYDNLDEYNAAGAAQGGHYLDYWCPNYHNFMKIAVCKDCDSAWASVDQNYLSMTLANKNLVGFESMPGIRSFLQPYYLSDLDTAARVIGVAAKIFGHQPPNSIYPYFVLYDHTGALIDTSMIFCWPEWSITGKYPYGPSPWYYPTPIKHYYFANQHQIQAFSIAFDKNNSWYDFGFAGNQPFEFDHTMSLIGGDKDAEWWHECRYEDLGCYEYIPPMYLMYDSTNWVSFNQDQYYQFYYKMQIGFFPIIIIPKTNSNLTSEELSEHCNILPNPVTTYAKVLSRYKIERLEVFDVQGKKVEEINVNDYEYYIGVQNYNKGTYLVNIVTQKGTTTKKMIVQ